jgi:hypothetical protein
VWPNDLKLQRAGKHLNDLQAEIDRWLGGEGHEIRVEPDPQRNGTRGRGHRHQEADEREARSADRLVDEGKVELHSTIDRWYPRIAQADQITLRMLGNMTGCPGRTCPSQPRG